MTKDRNTTANTQYSQKGSTWYAKGCSPLQLFVYPDRKSPAIPFRPYCQTLYPSLIFFLKFFDDYWKQIKSSHFDDLIAGGRERISLGIRSFRVLPGRGKFRRTQTHSLTPKLSHIVGTESRSDIFLLGRDLPATGLTQTSIGGHERTPWLWSLTTLWEQNGIYQ